MLSIKFTYLKLIDVTWHFWFITDEKYTENTTQMKVTLCNIEQL